MDYTDCSATDAVAIQNRSMPQHVECLPNFRLARQEPSRVVFAEPIISERPTLVWVAALPNLRERRFYQLCPALVRVGGFTIWLLHASDFV